MLLRLLSAIALLFLLPAVAKPTASAPASRSAASRPVASRPSIDGMALRIARSADGLAFVDAGAVFAHRAANPTLARLPDGAVIVAFDLVQENAKMGEACFCISRSSDEGRTWTPPTPIRAVGGGEATGIAPRHGCFLAMPDGRLRLFFVSTQRGPGGRTTIRCAVTPDGRDYALDASVHLAVPDGFDPHLLAARINKVLHLYVGNLREADDPRTPESPAVAHFISRDERRWMELTPLPLRNVRFAGGVATVRRFVRAYVDSREGVVSLTTTDGRKWTPEKGVRLAGARGAAVLALKDGSYLMLYGAEDDDASKKLPELAAGMGASHAGHPPAADGAMPGAPGGDAAGQAADAALGGGDGGTEAVSADAAPDWMFPPKPDFQNKVDYVSWYRDVLLDQGGDNAYPYYAAFMTEPGDLPGSKPTWPELKNLYTDESCKGPPGPWNPAEHPDWDASDQAVQPLLQLYREAASHANYATPVQYGDDAANPPPEAEPLLVTIMLPQLSQHRSLTRALLADAWRAENGKVSPERMLQAWQTGLGGARQLQQGATLIEQLVGTAEQGLVQDTARWALKQQVFDSPARMRQALDLLRAQDPAPIDPNVALRGEYAMSMDLTQYLFSPTEPGGPVRVNEKRLDYLKRANFFDSVPQLDEIGKMTPEDVTKTVTAFDSYYHELGEKMRAGYPTVRAADLNALSLQYAKASPVVSMLAPALGRVHQSRARSEASRRATQLTYAVHIYKSETGRWPASLSELPAEYGESMRTDPFTGQPFGYHATPDGPVIYSLSENGTDDAGVHSPTWGNGGAAGGSDDHVFWPPQPRK